MTNATTAPHTPVGDLHGRAAFGNRRRRTTNATICIMYEMTAPNTAMNRMTPVAVSPASSSSAGRTISTNVRMR